MRFVWSIVGQTDLMPFGAQCFERLKGGFIAQNIDINFYNELFRVAELGQAFLCQQGVGHAVEAVAWACQGVQADFFIQLSEQILGFIYERLVCQRGRTDGGDVVAIAIKLLR